MSVIQHGNADLNIEVAAPPGWTFAAGDTVIGTVSRRAPIFASEATVDLALIGQMKTELGAAPWSSYSSVGSSPVIGTTRLASGYRQLLKPKRHVMFQGPLHIGYNSETVSWTFEIDIPFTTLINSGNADANISPRHESEIFTERLPGTFHSFGGAQHSCSSAAWIEYYLEAELTYTQVGKDHFHMATCPITLRHPLVGFTRFGVQQRKMRRTIQRHRLMPDVEHGDHSFKQKTRRLFCSTEDPELRYEVEIHAPATIQLDNPAIIPYTLKFVQLDSTSESIKAMPRKVWLNWVKLTVGASTRVDVFSPIPTGELRGGTHWEFYELGLEKVFQEFDVFPLMLPLHQKSMSVNIGTILQLVLHSNGLRVGGKQLKRTKPIVPNFFLHGVRRSNWLDVEFSLTVAGENHRFSASTPLTLLAAD